MHNSLPPCTLVIFGATGDLTSRKLIPALFRLFCQGLLPSSFACVGFARREKDDLLFRKQLALAMETLGKERSTHLEKWTDFSQLLFYYRGDLLAAESYQSFYNYLSTLENSFPQRGIRLFYLATPSQYFLPIIGQLSSHQLIRPSVVGSQLEDRLIIEKPFGKDEESACHLDGEISQYLREDQIYRIDHYLGKEMVQNLPLFRMNNPIFESLWNRSFIDHVQITVAEELGVGTRGNFFESTGLLRDMIQNHLIQLLSLIAMELPSDSLPESTRDEKVRLLQAICPLQIENAVRGQYSRSFDRSIRGYREEKNVSDHSSIETFVALQLSIENERWRGVPFYLRSGKGLAQRRAEICLFFKPASSPNLLLFTIQPDAGIQLHIHTKVPQIDVEIQSVEMDFRYRNGFSSSYPQAYEKLLLDCMRGDNTLFTRNDELIASWKIFSPLLRYWESQPLLKEEFYPFGSWGPKSADQLLMREGRKWRIL